MYLGTHLTHFAKFNLKLIKDLKVIWNPVRLLEDNTGKNLGGIEFGTEFLIEQQ